MSSHPAAAGWEQELGKIMNRFLNIFLRYLTWFLVFFLIVRFFRFIVMYGIRFWFISIPLLIILYFYFRRRKRKFSSKLDPKKEVPIDAEFTILDEDEEEKK